MLYTLRGGGQMSNTFLESGGKYPPLLIIRGWVGRCPHVPSFIGGKCPRGQMSYTRFERHH